MKTHTEFDRVGIVFIQKLTTLPKTLSTVGDFMHMSHRRVLQAHVPISCRVCPLDVQVASKYSSITAGSEPSSATHPKCTFPYQLMTAANGLPIYSCWARKFIPATHASHTSSFIQQLRGWPLFPSNQTFPFKETGHKLDSSFLRRIHFYMVWRSISQFFEFWV